MCISCPTEVMRVATILKASRPSSVIEAPFFEASQRARALHAAAEEDVGRIRAEAEAERARALAEAAEAGRREGLGRAAAVLAGAAEARARRLDGLEDEVAAVALEVARAVLGRELSADPAAVVDLARCALAHVLSRREGLLRVSPADAPLLRAEQPRLAALLDRAPGLGLREDGAVPRGAVVVETEAGRVDARVEAQLAALERALAEAST